MEPKLISIANRAWGYETTEEIKFLGRDNWLTHRAYTPFGEPIGSVSFARRLHRLGIRPELNNLGDKSCTIGYSAKKKAWYAWSLEKTKSFRPGSKVKRGDVLANILKVGHIAKTNADARHMARLYAELVNEGEE